MFIIYWIYLILSSLLIFFLVLPFVMVLFSLLNKEQLEEKNISKQYDFGCIITAYKNAKISIPLIQSLLKQNYSNFEVYLVADECDLGDFNFEDPKLKVFNPNPPLRLKAKSIIHAIENFKRDHEYVVVFDADNLAHPDFLAIINKYANHGYKTIQGQRTAKNLDSVYACADSTGEFYKNYVERYVPYMIGSSSVISGSGMAVESNLYKAYLNGPEIQQGKEKWKKMLQEDKILQNDLLGKNEKITYAWDAVVYDEKVTSGDQVETQRSRWLFSYFQNLPNSSGLILKGLMNFSFNQLLFGIITISPPLFILLFSAIFMAVIGILWTPWISLSIGVALCIFIGNIFFSLYLSKVPKEIWKALWGMPLFVWNQVKGLLKMGNPNKNFKHSEHNRSYTIEEVLKSSDKNVK